jgi:hypothetical protein
VEDLRVPPGNHLDTWKGIENGNKKCITSKQSYR